YSAARIPDKIVATAEKAAELAPDNATVLIDLAATLLRYRRDWRQAESILKQACKHAISDVAMPFVEQAEGLIALEQGNAIQAFERLESALAGLKVFRNASPLTGGVIDKTHA